MSTCGGGSLASVRRPRHLGLVVVGVLSLLSAATALSAALATPPPGAIASHVSPLHDRRGLHPGLTAVPASQHLAARALITRVATTATHAAAGYDRSKDFGPPWTDQNTATWGRDGCPTREEILRRDLTAIALRSDSCVVQSGTLQDPYTATTIKFTKAHATRVQIDHVMPLAYDWAHGARTWTRSKRVEIANDPENLLAVQGKANDEKSDSGPADWLPPNPLVRCAYAIRFAQVSLKYALPVSTPDKTAMLTACR